MSYFVSRQITFPDGQRVVEISCDGPDRSGPDMLVAQYPGEGESYSDPREAVNAALDIKRQWQSDTDRVVFIDYGHNADMISLTDDVSPEDLRTWAEKEYEKLEKCER